MSVTGFVTFEQVIFVLISKAGDWGHSSFCVLGLNYSVRKLHFERELSIQFE